MKKRILLTSIALVTVLFAGCGSNNSKGGTADKPEAKSDKAIVSIKSGTYIADKDVKTSENEGLLALEVSIKNDAKDQLDFSKSDLTLYDGDGNKMASENVYTDDSSFKELGFTKLSGGKTENGYLVFKVEKDKEYELHYTPSFEISDDKEKTKDIEIKVDPSKYEDHSKDFEKMAETYVQQVFIGQSADEAKKTEDKDADKDDKKDKADKDDKKDKVTYELSNDLTAEHNEFNKKFVEIFKDVFVYYEPSTAEIEKTVQAYETANQKKAKITYQIAEMFPGKAVVYVRPEIINLSDVDAEAITDKFDKENRERYGSGDYKKFRQDGEKYLLQQLPSSFEQTKISTPEYMDGEGYKVTITKEKDKWTLDSSDSSKNYGFKSLRSAFLGGADD